MQAMPGQAPHDATPSDRRSNRHRPMECAGGRRAASANCPLHARGKHGINTSLTTHAAVIRNMSKVVAYSKGPIVMTRFGVMLKRAEQQAHRSTTLSALQRKAPDKTLPGISDENPGRKVA
ncbi:unnamed protein product [Ceratitis capitata]|uniref:(Mediterranean fruit fly) hypothetical protein n=1 Tax=Ceratitis capitata TaxID=7213 RepID=A0A811UU52_CERCA|nr:unnamed protein product [Ceratitis capitata]